MHTHLSLMWMCIQTLTAGAVSYLVLHFLSVLPFAFFFCFFVFHSFVLCLISIISFSCAVSFSFLFFFDTLNKNLKAALNEKRQIFFVEKRKKNYFPKFIIRLQFWLGQKQNCAVKKQCVSVSERINFPILIRLDQKRKRSEGTNGQLFP